MFMISESMRIGMATDHVPLKKVSELITVDTLMRKIRLMNQSLIFDFGIRKPRIAVLGLNPHAGDNSLLGTEEAEIISPAIQQAQKEGIMAFGPFPADGFFGAGSFSKFDGILAMYHDQGLSSIQGIVIRFRCKFYCRTAFYKNITCPWNCFCHWQVWEKHRRIHSVRRSILPATSSETGRCIRKYQKILCRHQDIEIHSDRIDELPPDIFTPEL